MYEEKTQVIRRCAHGSLTRDLNLLEIVGQLARIGIERYHADYSRQEITCHLPDVASVVIALLHPLHETATQFTTSDIAGAVRQSQRNEQIYADFIINHDVNRMRRVFRSDDWLPSHPLRTNRRIPVWNAFGQYRSQ